MPDTPLGDAAVGAAEPNAAAWPNCQWRKVCHGVRLQQDRYCLEHTDERRRHNLLQAVREGAPLDVRGTTISQVLLSRILGALRNDYVPAHDQTLWMTPGEPDFTGGRFTGSACFDHARFSGEARFNGVRFDRPASFRDVSFDGRALFDGAHFDDIADFRGARFLEAASFATATFASDAHFTSAQFNDDVSLGRARAAKQLALDAVTTIGAMHAAGATFEGRVSLRAAHTAGIGEFAHASFAGPLQLEGAEFHGGLVLAFAQLLTAERLGPVQAGSMLDATGLIAHRPVQLKVAAQRVICCGASFAHGLELQVQQGDIALDNATFGAPSTIISATIWRSDSQAAGQGGSFLSPVEPTPKARVVSVRGVATGELTLVDVDLGPCLFAGAHQLDQLQLQGTVLFTPLPTGLRWALDWPPVWRWTRRQALAEEHHYRASRQRRRRPSHDLRAIGWRMPASEPPSWLTLVAAPAGRPLPPARLVVLYRQLRKAQEDAKNEPGAADFYYGEMEMRRLAQHTPRAERLILTLYWMIAGYGLRASRALLTLVVVIALATWLLWTAGFAGNRPPLVTTSIYAVLSAVSVEGGTSHLTSHLSLVGDICRVGLRILSPVLIGLALLSIRNRVKR